MLNNTAANLQARFSVTLILLIRFCISYNMHFTIIRSSTFTHKQVKTLFEIFVINVRMRHLLINTAYK